MSAKKYLMLFALVNDYNAHIQRTQAPDIALLNILYVYRLIQVFMPNNRFGEEYVLYSSTVQDKQLIK